MSPCDAKHLRVDEQTISQRLVHCGMEVATAGDKGRGFAQALAGLREVDGCGDGEPYLLFVPGRIEVLGKHTDYAGGRSLLATTERGFCVVATAARVTTRFASWMPRTRAKRVSF